MEDYLWAWTIFWIAPALVAMYISFDFYNKTKNFPYSFLLLTIVIPVYIIQGLIFLGFGLNPTSPEQLFAPILIILNISVGFFTKKQGLDKLNQRIELVKDSKKFFSVFLVSLLTAGIVFLGFVMSAKSLFEAFK